MSLLDLVLLSLATWRVSSLVLYEDGPGAVFQQLRWRVGADVPGEVSGLAQLFSCLWCMSIWIGAILSPLLILGALGEGILAIPAASAVAVIIGERVVKR